MIIFLLILSVLVGVFLGKYFGGQQKFAKNLLILSAGFLITICLNDVFPEVYAEGKANIGFFVIAGVLLQMLLENLTKGFEHGHFHQHHEEKNILPAALMIGMFIHAFLEGIPLANETEVFSPYLMGILFHNLPISFVMGAFLIQKKKITKFYASKIGLHFFHLEILRTIPKSKSTSAYHFHLIMQPLRY